MTIDCLSTDYLGNWSSRPHQSLPDSIPNYSKPSVRLTQQPLRGTRNEPAFSSPSLSGADGLYMYHSDDGSARSSISNNSALDDNPQIISPIMSSKWLKKQPESEAARPEETNTYVVEYPKDRIPARELYTTPADENESVDQQIDEIEDYLARFDFELFTQRLHSSKSSDSRGSKNDLGKQRMTAKTTSSLTMDDSALGELSKGSSHANTTLHRGEDSSNGPDTHRRFVEYSSFNLKRGVAESPEMSGTLKESYNDLTPSERQNSAVYTLSAPSSEIDGVANYMLNENYGNSKDELDFSIVARKDQADISQGSFDDSETGTALDDNSHGMLVNHQKTLRSPRNFNSGLQKSVTKTVSANVVNEPLRSKPNQFSSRSRDQPKFLNTSAITSTESSAKMTRSQSVPKAQKKNRETSDHSSNSGRDSGPNRFKSDENDRKALAKSSVPSRFAAKNKPTSRENVSRNIVSIEWLLEKEYPSSNANKDAASVSSTILRGKSKRTDKSPEYVDTKSSKGPNDVVNKQPKEEAETAKERNEDQGTTETKVPRRQVVIDLDSLMDDL